VIARWKAYVGAVVAAAFGWTVATFGISNAIAGFTELGILCALATALVIDQRRRRREHEDDFDETHHVISRVLEGGRR